MKSPLSLLILVTFLTLISAGIAKSQLPDKESKAKLDLHKQLKDSGQYVKQAREGLWVEYSRDTALKGFAGNNVTVDFGSHKTELRLDNPVKATGVFRNGKKEGVWKIYKTYTENPPFKWFPQYEIEYKGGKKNGKEKAFNELNRVYMVRAYSEDKTTGLELYNQKSPFKLESRYKTIQGNFFCTESYYPEGELQAKFIDTIINKKELIYATYYYKSGKLNTTGFFKNKNKRTGTWTTWVEYGNIEFIENYDNDELNGEFKIFHENGNLWTERVYLKGKPWEVLSNFDKMGNQRNPGTLKNGNGTIIIYNESNSILRKEEYQNGIKR